MKAISGISHRFSVGMQRGKYHVNGARKVSLKGHRVQGLIIICMMHTVIMSS